MKERKEIGQLEDEFGVLQSMLEDLQIMFAKKNYFLQKKYSVLISTTLLFPKTSLWYYVRILMYIFSITSLFNIY